MAAIGKTTFTMAGLGTFANVATIPFPSNRYRSGEIECEVRDVLHLESGNEYDTSQTETL